MFNWDKKMKVAALSMLSNSFLIMLKIIAGIISGSVSIISEAIHSSIDLVASIIAFISVKFSDKPADKEHPYGYGKIEYLSGLAEGLLIFVAAAIIIYEAVKKIIHPAEISDTIIGISIMAISAISNFIVSRILSKTAKEEESVALEADALHLKTDVYTSLGVALGLLFIKLTGIVLLDPIIAILVALLILKETCSLVKKAFSPLIDIKLSDEEEEKIAMIIDKYKEKFLDYHMLKTRRAGKIKYIEFHMTVEDDDTVKKSHDLSKEIEKSIEGEIPNTVINIHIEPESDKE